MQQTFTFHRLLWGCCLAALTLIVWSHGRNLADVPRGLYQDEAAIGLNALTIAEDGRDEYGNLLPVFFRSFGDYKAPVLIYSAALLQKIAGPSVTMLRMTSVIFFLLLLLGVVRFAELLFGRHPAMTLGALLVTGFLPWLFPLSRIAFEVISQGAILIWIIVFVHATFEATEKKSWRAIMLGILLGLCLYSYPTSRLLVPLLLCCILALYGRRKNGRLMQVTLLSFAITCIPFIFFLLQTPEGLTARFSSITYVFRPDMSIVDKVRIFISNYFTYFSPRFLLFSGDGNLRHATGLGGQLSVPVFLLAVIGMLHSLVSTSSHRKFWNLLFMLLLLSPVAAALTQDGTPHALRSLPLAIVFICFALRGMHVLLTMQPHGTSLFFSVFACVALLNSGVLYVRDYFTLYPALSEKAFDSAGVLGAIEKAADKKPLRVIISDSISAVHAAFSLAYLDPDFPVNSMKLEVLPGACLIAREDETLPQTALPAADIALGNDTIVRLVCYSAQGEQVMR